MQNIQRSDISLEHIVIFILLFGLAIYTLAALIKMFILSILGWNTILLFH